MLIYGYVRVYTREQNEDRQLIAMKDYLIRLISEIQVNCFVFDYCSIKIGLILGYFY